MNGKPELSIDMSSESLTKYYYLKADLISFCRKYKLQASGSKQELLDRIALFLDTGVKSKQKNKPKKEHTKTIALDELIGADFVCTQAHRAFYKEHIGKSFTFLVAFQKWLKNNPDKTYRDSIQAYHSIVVNKKQHPSKIDPQFEYNAYIRAFFHDNKDKSLRQAIQCWNYKKSCKGNHQYERSDLAALNNNDIG